MNATKMIVSFRIAIALTVAILWAACSTSYAAPAGVGQMFRLDGGDATYVFGVNERGELQALYWGGKLAPSDKNAAAHSLPIVAHNIGGVSEAVRDGVTGLLVTPERPAELAAAFEKLIHDPALRKRLGSAGRIWAARNCWEENASTLFEKVEAV